MLKNIQLRASSIDDLCKDGHQMAKEEFLLDEIAILAISAGLQRSRSYFNDANTVRKENFRNLLKVRLSGLRLEKEERDLRSDHFERIQEFQEASRDPTILKNGIISFGVAQKIVNLYLKYLWCLGIFKSSPPHCPFDRNVIHVLRQCCDNQKDRRWLSDIAWTEMTQADYVRLVGVAQSSISSPSIAEWELGVFNKKRRDAADGLSL
jgi:hypothetical protein